MDLYDDINLQELINMIVNVILEIIVFSRNQILILEYYIYNFIDRKSVKQTFLNCKEFSNN